jgi:hypothetical protein
MKVVEEGRRQTDVIELLPASMKVADMMADNPGNWLLECHVANHMAEGMFAQFTVFRKDTKTPAEPAFFGLRQSRASLEIRQARLTGAGPASSELRIEGRVTVPQAFSVFVIPVGMKIGEKAVQFKPDRSGRATNGLDTFWVKNASQYGVVYGGYLEFEAHLRDSKWLPEIKKLGEGVAGKSVSITLQINKAEHKAMAEVTLGGP